MHDVPPFVRTAVHVDEERRFATVGERTDRNRILQTRDGKFLGLLRYLGFLGGLVYCAVSVRKLRGITWYSSTVVEDHAAGVIRKAIERTVGNPDLVQPYRTRRPAKRRYLRSVVQAIPTLYSGFHRIDTMDMVAFIRFWKLGVFYVTAVAMFSQRRPVSVLLVRTSDLKRLAIGAAAEASSVPVATFTIERIGLRRHAPYRVDTVFCWTNAQARYYGDVGVEAVQMPVPTYRGIASIPDTGGTVGLLLNAKCEIPRVASFLKEVKHRFQLESIVVRPHPGFDLSRLAGLPNAVISDWRESLDHFLDRIDVAFALNTNAIIEALLHGVPVVFVPGLDRAGYDVHGFVAEGIVFSWGHLNDFPRDVNDFFQASAFQQRWSNDAFNTDARVESRGLARFIGL